MEYKFKLKFLDYNPDFKQLTDSIEGFSAEDATRVKETFSAVLDKIYESHFKDPPSDEAHVAVLDLINILHKSLIPGTKEWEYFIILLLSERIQLTLSQLYTEEMKIRNLLLGEGGKS